MLKPHRKVYYIEGQKIISVPQCPRCWKIRKSRICQKKRSATHWAMILAELIVFGHLSDEAVKVSPVIMSTIVTKVELI